MAAYEKYWINRADKRMADRQEYLDKSIAEINNAYESAMKQLGKEIDKLYLRFVSKAGITDAEARALLKENISAKEAEQIRNMIDTISDAEIKKQLLNRLEASYYKQRISREEALKESVRIWMSRIADKELEISTKTYTEIIKEEYLHNIFDCQQYFGIAFSFGELPERIIEQILQDNWSGSHYSKRIWGNTQTMAKQIEELLLKGAMVGTGSRKLAKELNDIADTGMYACERLIRTETTYFTAMSDLEAAKQRGTKEVRFVATLDGRTSRQCREADGKILAVEDAVPGRNIPPLHPFCRSVIIDVIGGLVHKARRARNAVTGKNYNVPADMKYDEWKKLPLTEKKIDFGQVKGVIFQKTAEETLVMATQVEEIKSAVGELSADYNIKLDYFELGNYTEGEYRSIPIFYKAVNEDGIYKSKLVINNACPFWTDEQWQRNVFTLGQFAGKSVKEFTWHEIGHVLTYQGCSTIQDYYQRERKTRSLKRFGISKYADSSIDGAETVAEAFVLKRQGKILKPDVEDMLKQYTEVWRK